MTFLVIFEQGPTSVGAYLPDVPGCVAVGKTQQEAQERLTEALRMHLEGLREDGEVLPLPVSSSAMLTLPALTA
jgi:predicted RNase H-like HicB family nuclease